MQNILRIIPKGLVLTLCMFCGINAPLNAEQMSSRLRGELLYSTHCSACHTAEIHWREKNLATDWNSLKVQVNRWQIYSELGWSDNDIIDVTLYLNITFYNFLNNEPNSFSQGKKFDLILRNP